MQTITNHIQQAIVESIAQTLISTRYRWIQIATSQLSTTRNDYIQSLYVELPNVFMGILFLQGKWANALEQGFPPFDMKKGFQRSPKAKRTKNNGWYLNIPFSHHTPSQTLTAKQVMPQDIYRQARMLKIGERLTGTETRYPSRRAWTGYRHQSGIYENMIRTSPTSKGRPPGHYHTFRRVSNKSDPMSFWHRGFKGVQAIRQIEAYAEQKFTELLTQKL